MSHGEMILCDQGLRAELGSNHDMGLYVDQVVELLTELSHYDEAMEIALSYGSESSAYCLFKAIELSNNNQKQNCAQSHQNSNMIWDGLERPSDKRPGDRLERIVAPFINRLSNNNLIKLA